ncbi:hypothetical protein BZA77DRAFT_146526 [Pyronema omphalodes]|nr:hypothetical protein BZA77DRAFT_146526 [Pyronema omphalodes]
MDPPRSHVRRRSEASAPSAPSTIRRLHSRRPSSPGVSSISSATTQSIWEQLAATSTGLNRVEPSLSAERPERAGSQWTQPRDSASRDEAGDSDTEGEQSTVLSQIPRYIAEESGLPARITFGSVTQRDTISRNRERAMSAAYLDSLSSSRSEAATPNPRTTSRNSEMRRPSNTESDIRPHNPFSRSSYATILNRRRPDIRSTTTPIPPIITRATPAPPTPQNPGADTRTSASSPEPRSIRDNTERIQQNAQSLERSINQLQQRLLMDQIDEGRRDRAPQERVEIRDSSHRRPESLVRVRDPRPERTPVSMNRPGSQVRVGGGVRLSQHTAEGAVASTTEQGVDEGRNRGQMQDIASNRLREYLAGYERRDGEPAGREFMAVEGFGELIAESRERERERRIWGDLIMTEGGRAERAERAGRLAERVERAQERPASARHHMRPTSPSVIVRQPIRAQRALRTPGTPWRGRRTSSTSGVAGSERFYDGPFRSHGMEETLSPPTAPSSAEAERAQRSPPLSPRERIAHSTIRHEAERELRPAQLSPRQNTRDAPRVSNSLYDSWRGTEDA